MRRRTEFPSESGSTLVELLLALMLGGYLIGGAVLTLQAIVERRTLCRESAAVARAIERSTVLATGSGETVSFHVEPTGWRISRGEYPLEHHFFSGRVESAVPTGLTLRVIAYPSGSVTPRTIILRSGAAARNVTISLRGRTSETW